MNVQLLYVSGEKVWGNKIQWEHAEETFHLNEKAQQRSVKDRLSNE